MYIANENALIRADNMLAKFDTHTLREEVIEERLKYKNKEKNFEKL
jgi:hypothetical protein